MFKRRLLTLMGIAVLALSTAAWADDDIQIQDETVPTATPAAKPAVHEPQAQDQVAPTPTLDADDVALLKEIEAEKAAKVTPKTAPQATPTPADEETSEEDATPTPVGKPTPVVKKVNKHKVKPTPTPTPNEDEGYDQEDQTEKGRNLGKRLGALDKPLLNFTLDGVYSKAFNTNPSTEPYSNGFGLDFRMDVQFYRWIALGLYYDFVDFSGANALTGSIGMFGRVIPLKEGPLEFYAIGGMGLNSLEQVNPRGYPANFHGFAGAGLHTSFTDNWGLDSNLVYNYYSPDNNPLNTVAVRAGITYAVDLQAFLASLTGETKVKPGGEAKEPE